ncbi:MAG: ferric reductase-like transmembrane domain-containing protein [Actinomycetota bacterium]|nr:ferric reductase-like transmembrane domain-containing protein [Actinomycetota bacterium]
MDQSLSFATRATGLVTLMLLTGNLVLGIATAGRASRPSWPRFALAALHRNISLLAVLFLGVHVSTSIIDPGAGVRWLDALVPFLSDDRPLWLGLGTVALDLLLAAIATSMLRTRLSFRMWRGVHWAAYASWPAALIHGAVFGDEDNGLSWVIGLYISCIVAVALALLWRRRSTRYPSTRYPPTPAHRRAAMHGGR